jgi:hypothetical protein
VSVSVSVSVSVCVCVWHAANNGSTLAQSIMELKFLISGLQPVSISVVDRVGLCANIYGCACACACGCACVRAYAWVWVWVCARVCLCARRSWKAMFHVTTKEAAEEEMRKAHIYRIKIF